MFRFMLLPIIWICQEKCVV
ncbi:hypothetical protein Gotur_023638 [Gossypium turneri]